MSYKYYEDFIENEFPNYDDEKQGDVER